MEVVGAGFIAGHLRALGAAHPDAVVFAAGVSNATCTSRDEFAAETGLLNRTLRRCRADGRSLVYLSTAGSDLYGAIGPGVESATAAPASAYGRHKLACEAVPAESAVRVLVLRLGSVSGPGQRPHQLVPVLARQVRGGAVVVHRGAHRDLIGVTHVVRCVDALLSAGVREDVVNVASGVSVAVEHIVDHLESRIGGPVRRQYVDRPDAFRISIAKLRRLVPVVREWGFGPDYYRRVLDQYLSAEHLV